MHLVDDSQRIQQLTALRTALETLLPVFSEVAELRGSRLVYQACLEEATRLLAQGFSQDELSTLSRNVPRLFWLRKEWTPELERSSDGSYRVPSWFENADRLHQRVQDAAEDLRVIGRY